MRPSAHPPFPTRALATALWVCYAAAMTSALVMRGLAHTTIWQFYVVPFTAFATVGWVLAARRPRNALGWVFLGIGVLTGIGVVGDGGDQLALARGWQPHGVVVFLTWTQAWFWYPLVTLATAYTMLLFPNGLPARRWRPVLVVLTASVVAITVLAALTPRLQFGTKQIRNPIGLSTVASDIESTLLFKLLTAVMLVCMVAAVVSLGLRFRRSRNVERAQLKWFLLAAAVLGSTFVLSLAWPAFNTSTANDVLFPVALACLPLSCGLAILRYRLYDIDRIVSRTVSYAVVTGAVVATYVGAVALAERVLSFSSSFAVAASTLVVAAMFQPLRRRVQWVVDRRFDRAAYDARRTVDAFSARLRDQVDVDTVRGDLMATVSSAVAPARMSWWVPAGPLREGVTR